MLRDSEDAPAALAKLTVDLTIPFSVACDLGLPELFVTPRGPVALGASMPEAPVHEDHQPLLPEGEVRFSRELQMSPPSGDAFLTEELHQHPLRPPIPSPLDPRHQLGPLHLGEYIGHGIPSPRRHPAGSVQHAPDDGCLTPSRAGEPWLRVITLLADAPAELGPDQWTQHHGLH
jgi:hypothetical protein